MRRCFALFLLPGVAACSSSYPTCDETPTTLASIDDVAPTGLTARELLDLAIGTHTYELRWHPSRAQQPARIDTVPMVESSPLTLTVAHHGGGIRHIDNQVVEPKRGNTVDLAVTCDPRLEVDVEVSLRTEDGALDEHWMLPLSRTVGLNGESATTLHHKIDPRELQGSLQLTAFDPPDPDDVTLVFDIAFGPDFIDGRLTTQLIFESKKWVTATETDLAEWGTPPERCGSLDTPCDDE